MLIQKKKTCSLLGINVKETSLNDTITEYELLEKLEELNMDSKIHGILIQLPLTKIH